MRKPNAQRSIDLIILEKNVRSVIIENLSSFMNLIKLDV